MHNSPRTMANNDGTIDGWFIGIISGWISLKKNLRSPPPFAVRFDRELKNKGRDTKSNKSKESRRRLAERVPGIFQYKTAYNDVSMNAGRWERLRLTVNNDSSLYPFFIVRLPLCIHQIRQSAPSSDSPIQEILPARWEYRIP